MFIVNFWSMHPCCTREECFQRAARNIKGLCQRFFRTPRSRRNAFNSKRIRISRISSTHIPGDTAQQKATPGHGQKHVNPVPDTSMDDEHATQRTNFDMAGLWCRRKDAEDIREAILELIPRVTGSPPVRHRGRHDDAEQSHRSPAIFCVGPRSLGTELQGLGAMCKIGKLTT